MKVVKVQVTLINDNENVQEGVPVKKNVCGPALKQRKLTNQQVKTKMNRNFHCTSVLNTLTERRIL